MLEIDARHDYERCGGPDRCSYCYEIAFVETSERACRRAWAENQARKVRLPDRIDPRHPYATCGGSERCDYCRQLFAASAAKAKEPDYSGRGLPVRDFTPPNPYESIEPKSPPPAPGFSAPNPYWKIEPNANRSDR